MIKKLFLTVLIIVFVFLNFTISVRANSVIFEDDFSQDLSKWQLVRGSLSDWRITDQEVIATIIQNFKVSEIRPTDQELVISFPYRYDVDFIHYSGADKNFVFNYRNNENWFEFHYSGNSVYLAETYQGITHNLANKYYPLVLGQKYHATIEVNTSQVSFFINDNLLISYSNDSLSEKLGTISLRAGTGSVSPTIISFDNVKVTALDDRLGVEQILQTQQPWGPMEYDTASKWVAPGKDDTFSRWGCALTSMTMLMRYYDINKLADGTDITPLSLNNYMLDHGGFYQKTGYVSFPWLAALTKKLSDQYGHKALQYSRVEWEPESAAAADLQIGRPVIVEKPGHFMVADGYIEATNETDQDFFIVDPLFASFEKFSEHQEPMLSARLFEPSMTDVSYIEILADPTTRIELFDSTNHELEVDRTLNFLKNTVDSSATSPSVQSIEIAQPAEGYYRLALFPSSTATLPTMLRVITKNGEVTEHMFAETDRSVLLNFKRETASPVEVVEPEGFSKIRQLLFDLRQADEIFSELTYQELDQLAVEGEQHLDVLTGLESAHSLKKAVMIHFSQKAMSVTAKNQLLKAEQEIEADLKQALPSAT